MTTNIKAFADLIASDLMNRDVIAIPESLSVKDAAHRLSQHGVGRAPVVDADGRCIGVLGAIEFIHWAENGSPCVSEGVIPCPYRVKGRLLTGGEGVICTLGFGECPWQEMRPSTGGRHIALCVKPAGVLGPWEKKVPGDVLESNVKRFMSTHVVTISPQTPVPEAAQVMMDAHTPQIVVVDKDEKPIGVLSATDVLGAVAQSTARGIRTPCDDETPHFVN